MRRLAAIVLLLLLLAAAATGAGPTPMAAAARAAAGGDFRAAVQGYEQALSQEGYSAPVLFNLGNAWLHLGQPARAILQYERALVLAPRNPTIEANLAAAQQQAGVTPLPAGPWLSAARTFSFDTYIWAGLAALWVLCAALVMLCFPCSTRRLARLLTVLSALTLCVSADAAVLCWSDLYRAVLVEPASLQLAPAASAAASGALRAGEVVWSEARYGAFTRVRTADGHAGWVADPAALPVRP